MIQYHLDLFKQVKNIKEKSLSQGQIQKIYSTAYYISVSVRIPGKTWNLYFGRGGGFEGVWIYDSPPPSVLRRRDNFLEYLRRHLTSCSFLNISLDSNDRILRMDYQKFGCVQSFFWFWKGRKLYFMHYYQEEPESVFKILLSWRGKAFVPNNEITNLFDYFDEIGRHHEMKNEIFSKEIPDVGILLEEELSASKNKSQNVEPTFLLRKENNIKEDLRKASQWQQLQSILDDQEPLDHLYELKVGDHKIKFDSQLNSFERRNLLFQKIKKLKRGESILMERLNSVEKLLIGKEFNAPKLSPVPIIKPVWGEEKSKPIQINLNQDDHKILIFDGFQAGVGLNAHGNDYLRNRWANKQDHWIHLDGKKSAHVILKINNNNPMTSEIVNIGASIVAHFSHFKSEWIPIIHTQVKNLKGISGAPGMVTYKKEKHLNCLMQDLGSMIKD